MLPFVFVGYFGCSLVGGKLHEPSLGIFWPRCDVPVRRRLITPTHASVRVSWLFFATFSWLFSV